MSKSLPALVKASAAGKVAFCLPRSSYEALGLYLVEMADTTQQPLPVLEDGDALTQHLMVAFAAQMLHTQRGFAWHQPFNRFTLTRAGAITLLGVLWGVSDHNQLVVELRNRLHQALA
jgi:hypothetical protein